MELMTAAATASSLLSNALNGLKIVRERAQTSKDSDLKDRISGLYDILLSLKEAVMLVNEENDQLKRRIVALTELQEKPKPELRQVGAVNYYFVGDKGPYCQRAMTATASLSNSPHKKIGMAANAATV